MTAHSPAPEGATQEPVKKPRFIPWTALISIVVLWAPWWPPSLADMLPQPGGKYVQSVAITKGAGDAGEIQLTATLKTEGVERRIAGRSVHLLSADGGMNWVCRAGTVPERSLPQNCRASQ